VSDNPYDLGRNRSSRAAIEVAGWFSQRARRRRYDRFRRTMRPQPHDRLLDVGCGSGWSLAQLDPDAKVTGVDLVDRGGFERPNQRFVAADAGALPFTDNSFDVGYSNALIEHIPVEQRPEFADELRRVARRYWVQTPNFWFPLEPHALLPAVQFLPPRVRRLAWRASPRQIGYEESLSLLSRFALARLFDDALILEERVGPLVKSLIAVGPRTHFRARR